MKTIMLSFVPSVNQDIRETVDAWVPRDPGILILIGTLLLVTLGAFIWAAFFRKRKRRPHYQFRHRHPEDRLSNQIKERWKAGKFLWHRHRRRRHRQRRRNPTLAEAGGLPPIRTEEHPRNST